MFATVRTSIELSRLPRDARRIAMLGPWARVSRELRGQLMANAPVDLVLLGPQAVEAGPFIAGDLVPRPLWCYDGWDAWRKREPLPIIRDARGVNAAVPPPPRAGVVVAVDLRRDPPAWIVQP